MILGASADSPHPEQRLADLLLGPFAIDAVVPGMIDAFAPGQTLPVRDVVVDGSELLAVRAGVVATAPIDPHDDDPRSVIRGVLAHLNGSGRRVVCESSWMAGGDQLDARAADPDPYRILVVTGVLEARSVDPDRQAAWELIDSLARLSVAVEVTAAAVERTDDPAVVQYLRGRGIDAVDGPIDWQRWFTSRAGSFTHVIVMPTGLHSSVRRWIDLTQPGALKMVFWPRLPQNEVTGLAAISQPDELPGLDLVRRATAESVSALGQWADAVLCQAPSDASYLSSTVVGRPVFVLPPKVSPTLESGPMMPRRGMAVVAVDGHDVLAGNEDSAIRVLEGLLPQIRWREPDLACTVVADRPTPMLEGTARSAGATIVPSTELDRVISSARIVVAAHGYGTGQPGVLRRVLASGTPFVATPNAVGNLDLGRVRELAVFESEPDLVTRGCQLLSDEDARTAFAQATHHLLSNHHGPEARHQALIRALAYAGVDAGRPADRLPSDGLTGHRVVTPNRKQVELRPGMDRTVPRWLGLEPATERERYQVWVQRFGPTPEVLHAIRLQADGLTYRPRVSVLMPVYNTDREVLLEAIDSVRGQLYRNWQLCIADDGSDRPETREVLGSLAGTPSVVVVHLDGSSGISGATNAALAVADGEYVTFLDHDDLLKPHALAQVARWLDADPMLDVVYTDEDKVGDDGELYDPHLKPDYSPDQLMNHNYISHLTVVRTSLLRELDGLRTEYDGSQDHDLMLRLSEVTNRIAHIPEPLYTWRAVAGSAAAVVDAKPYALDASRRAISAALTRRGYSGRVDDTKLPGCYRARYELPGQPRVSIIIPTKDRADMLKRCINGVLEQSTYKNFEILVIDNQSTDAQTLGYLASAPIRVIRYPHRFNYARMMNYAARSVECDAMLFLNNDTKIITPDWIEALLEHAMRPGVGAVGGRLYFPDGSVQHEGVMVGVWGGWAGNIDYGGYWNRGDLIRNTSAVTGACTMIRPSVYWQVGGNDERLRVAYNDVDLCLRIRQAGYEIVYTPFAELYHYESASRSGYEHPMDGPLFGTRWLPRDSIDPYYSPMLSNIEPFKVKI
jgi:GT2 family glycosyltransferase